LAYTLRHKRRSLLLVALIALAVTGIYLLVGLFQESFVTPEYTVNRYLRHFSLVQTEPLSALDPDVVARIRQHPHVARVLPQNNVEISVPNVGGLNFPFRLLGLREEDVGAILSQSGVALREGRLPQPGSNGVALSREVARALGLEVGDTFDRSRDAEDAFIAYYTNIVSPLEVVGILSGDVRLGIVSYEYLESHEGYQVLAHDGLLVIARPGREAAVDDFLRQTLQSSSTQVYTYQGLEAAAASSQATLNAIFVPIILLVTTAVTLVIGAINRLAFLERLPEFGTLHAIGRSRGWLARRLVLETTGLAVAGWVLGLLASWGAMSVISAALYAPRGFAFAPVHLPALLLVIPIPLAVIGFTLFTALRALRRMDAVAVVERGELSLERSGPGRARSEALLRPLAVTTFYRRHRGQAATLILAMGLMIIGTALIVFVFNSVFDASQPLLNLLSRTSRVSTEGLPLEMEERAQIRDNPAVERVIPVSTISPLALTMPLIRYNSPLETHGVTPEDLSYLVHLYDLEVAEGRLPRHGSNEIVIPWTAAQNRNLEVGDVIGDPDHPIYPDAPPLPSELVVSGIFAPAGDPAEDVWLSFVSREFIEKDRDGWNTTRSLIVVPQSGKKASLDAWLESTFANEEHTVVTYGSYQAILTEAMRAGLFALSLMESIVALMAALALAGLNYLFVMQRRAEFGVLSALGWSRRQLVGRVTRETLFTTGVAWLIGVLGCAAVLVYLHYDQYAPLGLRLNFFSLTPWLFTLPVPVTVLAVNAGAVSRALSRLDPVAVIERR
jgi:ABC-type antimicrobial peptide transport system permease subunit